MAFQANLACVSHFVYKSSHRFGRVNCQPSRHFARDVHKPRTVKADMRRASMRRIIGTLFLSVCCFGTTSALAYATSARKLHPVIRSIDRQIRTLSLIYDRGRGPQTLVLKAATKSLRNWKFISATELKVSAHATVHYHLPFLGMQFTTRAVWFNGS